jgi:hypothetical protein
MAGLPPEQRQYYMQQQQLVIAQMQQQVRTHCTFCCNVAGKAMCDPCQRALTLVFLEDDIWQCLVLQQAVMGEKMEEMSQEERKDFINQQMDSLQHELEKVSAHAHHGAQTISAGLHLGHSVSQKPSCRLQAT